MRINLVGTLYIHAHEEEKKMKNLSASIKISPHVSTILCIQFGFEKVKTEENIPNINTKH
jgi:hypothetical protein